MHIAWTKFKADVNIYPPEFLYGTAPKRNFSFISKWHFSPSKNDDKQISPVSHVCISLSKAIIISKALTAL